MFSHVRTLGSHPLTTKGSFFGTSRENRHGPDPAPPTKNRQDSYSAASVAAQEESHVNYDNKSSKEKIEENRQALHLKDDEIDDQRKGIVTSDEAIGHLQRRNVHLQSMIDVIENSRG